MTYFNLKLVTSIVVDVPRPICNVRAECILFRYFARSQGGAAGQSSRFQIFRRANRLRLHAIWRETGACASCQSEASVSDDTRGWYLAKLELEPLAVPPLPPPYS